MLRKRNVITVLVLVLIGGVTWYFWGKGEEETVQTETVRRGDIVETVSVTGELVPEVYADLSFARVGTIDEVFVKNGDMVQAGARLLSLDREVMYSEYKEAALAAAVAEENEKHVRRNRTGASTPEDVNAKKLLAEQARENVRTLQARMKESVLYAPFAGRISQFSARVGEVVTAGKIMARIMQPETLLLESRVPESDIAKVALGMQAAVTFDAFTNDENFVAEVIEIDPASTVVQDVVSYRVKFRLKTADPRFKEGMTGNIDIETAKRAGVLFLPYRALSKEGEKMLVAVRRGETAFEKVEVTTGLEGDDGTIEIKSGLKEGDSVTIGATQKK